MEFISVVVIAAFLVVIILIAKSKKKNSDLTAEIFVSHKNCQPLSNEQDQFRKGPTAPIELNDFKESSDSEALDGKFLVRYVDEKPEGDAIWVTFQITCGPSKGTFVHLVLASRIAKAAIAERGNLWTSWMAFEGDKMCGDLENARHQAYEDQFIVKVKDGQVRSIIDPSESWEEIERLIIKQGDRVIGEFKRPEWEELVTLAIEHKVPLDVDTVTNPDKHEQMIPMAWEDGVLVLKKAGGRKILKIRKDEFCGFDISEPGQGGPADYPPTMDAFVLALVRSSFEELRCTAISLLELLDVSPADESTWAIIQGMAQDNSPRVRGMVADECRSWTPRVRKTVMKVSYSMIDSIPAVFSLLDGLVKDPVAAVRQKACYALGDHPGTPAGSILETLSRSDDSKEVRQAALHALERIKEFEKIRFDYEAAVSTKTLKSSSKTRTSTP